jgi:hypothetical protein
MGGRSRESHGLWAPIFGIYQGASDLSVTFFIKKGYKPKGYKIVLIT